MVISSYTEVRNPRAGSETPCSTRASGGLWSPSPLSQKASHTLTGAAVSGLCSHSQLAQMHTHLHTPTFTSEILHPISHSGPFTAHATVYPLWRLRSGEAKRTVETAWITSTAAEGLVESRAGFTTGKGGRAALRDAIVPQLLGAHLAVPPRGVRAVHKRNDG